MILGLISGAQAVILYRESWRSAVGTSMELVKALAPPAAALIALIAVFVNLRNTRKQIDANAANLEKQLKANADNLERQFDANAKNLERQLAANAENMQVQLDASARNLTEQLEFQAEEARRNRSSQLDQITRAERRETLIRAAEVVHKLQDAFNRVVDEFQRPSSANYEKRQSNLSAALNSMAAASLESHFVATTLEMISLNRLARALRAFERSADNLCTYDGAQDYSKHRKLDADARALFAEFAANLRG
ncbi:hypothetical protein D2E61_08145 [Mycobacteroides abscessus]|nr:hypothetical protein D2E61_08145 [Mycobacteroides abscessus]